MMIQIEHLLNLFTLSFDFYNDKGHQVDKMEILELDLQAHANIPLDVWTLLLVQLFQALILFFPVGTCQHILIKNKKLTTKSAPSFVARKRSN